MPTTNLSADLSSELPPFPPGGVTAGVDWASNDHAIAVVDVTGAAIDRLTVTAKASGLRELVARLSGAGVQEVAIERCDTPPTVALRSAVRARKDLLTHRIGLANQLRAHLQFFYPGPVGLFTHLDAPTSLRFLTRFTCQDDADWLTPARLATWLRSTGYPGRSDPAKLRAHLEAAPRGATGPAGAAAATVTMALVTALTAIAAQVHTLEAHITDLFRAHPDAPICLSLPRTQALRGGRLLGEIGDCRARSPTPNHSPP
jgi:hypothetical protein